MPRCSTNKCRRCGLLILTNAGASVPKRFHYVAIADVAAHNNAHARNIPHTPPRNKKQSINNHANAHDKTTAPHPASAAPAKAKDTKPSSNKNANAHDKTTASHPATDANPNAKNKKPRSNNNVDAHDNKTAPPKAKNNKQSSNNNVAAHDNKTAPPKAKNEKPSSNNNVDAHDETATRPATVADSPVDNAPKTPSNENVAPTVKNATAKTKTLHDKVASVAGKVISGTKKAVKAVKAVSALSNAIADGGSDESRIKLTYTTLDFILHDFQKNDKTFNLVAKLKELVRDIDAVINDLSGHNDADHMAKELYDLRTRLWATEREVIDRLKLGEDQEIEINAGIHELWDVKIKPFFKKKENHKVEFKFDILEHQREK